MELLNYSDGHILNSSGALKRNENNKMVTAFTFMGPKAYTAYEDGLICCWNVKEGKLVTPLVGHTNKVTCLIPTNIQAKLLYSCSNDCTIRQWDFESGLCL